MTGTGVDLETQARQIAARGHAALLERMRTAYSDAAAAHADLISLDEDQIEGMVQAATDRADGLQWRRALAAVAAEELGISPSEALSHAAVVRAQQLVGAPSYEQGLAEMIARPVPLPATNGNGAVGGAARAAAGGAAAAAEPGVEAADAADAASAGGPEPEPPVPPLPEPIPEPPAPEPEPEPEPVPGPAVADATPEPITPAPAVGSDEAEPSDELETVEADDVMLELLPEPDPIEYETEVYDVEASFAHERVPPAPTNPFAARAAGTADEPTPAEPLDAKAERHEPETAEHEPAVAQHELAAAEEPEDTEITIPAVHLGGVANLPTKREGLSVRLSADGLDIMQGPRDIIGRLIWDEIEALEVPNLRVRRRAKQLRARLVVRTPHGDASFEVPDVSGDELRERVEPIMALYGRQ